MILLPMLYVQDLEAEVAWFEAIGFVVANSYTPDTGPLAGRRLWAILAQGKARLMITYRKEGLPSTTKRDADLYILTDDLENALTAIRDKARVVEGPRRRPYGMREFTLRSPAGFRLTFGCPDDRDETTRPPAHP